MLKLHLVRHGKTERHAADSTDYNRKLIDRGIRQSIAVGSQLSFSRNVKVFCSSAMRTTETLEGIKTIKKLPEAKYLKELYLCSSNDYLNIIWKEKGDDELLFVGHNFGISDLASYLTDENIELRTGEYIVIGFDLDSWEEISKATGSIIYRYRLDDHA